MPVRRRRWYTFKVGVCRTFSGMDFTADLVSDTNASFLFLLFFMFFLDNLLNKG
jgi:hypothetical protein